MIVGGHVCFEMEERQTQEGQQRVEARIGFFLQKIIFSRIQVQTVFGNYPQDTTTLVEFIFVALAMSNSRHAKSDPWTFLT